jgi:hypothetical protein
MLSGRSTVGACQQACKFVLPTCAWIAAMQHEVLHLRLSPCSHACRVYTPAVLDVDH